MTRLRSLNWTFEAMGSEFGISAARVGQILSEQRQEGELRVGEVAKRIGVHIRTIQKWDKLGLLRPYRVGPRRERRYLETDINQFLRDSTSRRLGGPLGN